MIENGPKSLDSGHRVDFLPVTEVRILPEWRSFLSHEVIVRAVGKLMKAGDMIENGPKSLDSGHRVDFLQIGLILCCRYSLSCPEHEISKEAETSVYKLTYVSRRSTL